MNTRRRIGGLMDYSLLMPAQPAVASTESDHARIVHRPTDPEALRLAAIELQGSGLKPADIAQALQLSAAAVKQLLEAPSA